MAQDNKLCLGAIVGVHGIKGEVKVKSFTEIPDDIDQYGTLYDKDNNPYQIKVIGHSKELLRVKIKGVEDRNQAEALKGTELFVDRDILPDLNDEDEFYHADLIGLNVKLLSSDEIVGTIGGIYNFGAGDVLEIKLPSQKSEMIPFTKAYVPEINIKDGYIIVETPVLNFISDESDEG